MIKFFFEHLGYGMRGQSPVCYNEWLGNGYEYYLDSIISVQFLLILVTTIYLETINLVYKIF